MNDRPTFSPFWHRVRLMKPKLRPHVQITRQHYRGRRWHVVHDPTSNQFYRLNPIAYDFIGMLDGARDVSRRRGTLRCRSSAMPRRLDEIIQLIGQLYQSNLLSVDTSPETEQLLRRPRSLQAQGHGPGDRHHVSEDPGLQPGSHPHGVRADPAPRSRTVGLSGVVHPAAQRGSTPCCRTGTNSPRTSAATASLIRNTSGSCPLPMW